ncbi:diacylglycerol kinase family protein [Plantibacter sp. ME-Dv--P-095]|uniref:diacylglycerol/lipid kinase family protein n=1 Tax=Plantibacter sp. ME-Dv--P-095 TaxID=3040299 RepID=UPI00254EC4C0|nr:diacylglycerol kinase family protein [Plantibacter sp. ME-Dv--P-095]
MNPRSTRPHAAVVYNPTRVQLERLRRLVDDAASDAGWGPTTWIPTRERSAAVEQVAEALDGGAALVIAAGGDGTVREVAGAMRHTRTPFAVVPLGTANLFARNAGIPIDTAAAVRAAFTGEERRIDVGSIEYRRVDGVQRSAPFLVMTGFGVDADMVAYADPVLKRRFGWVAYVGPIVRGLFRRDRPRLSWKVDGGSMRSARTHTMFVGNCGTVSAGLDVLPDALIDDGVLDVLMVRSLEGWDGVRVTRWLHRANNPVARLTRSKLARPRPRPSAVETAGSAGGAVRYLRAERLDVTVSPPAAFQADGDGIGLVAAARVTVDAGALLVRLPVTTSRSTRLGS